VDGDGDGAPLLAMHRVALGWNDGASADECESIGDTLDREAPPDQLAPLIAAVADEPLQALLDAESIALNDALTACLGLSTVPSAEDVAPLGEIAADVQARLDQLDASRQTGG
jgi:hypothetical protein